ncbi:NepR family anti-sigma factor [Methylobacterium organophilum]|uniref:Anti-sigma factor NepR domain-containing protein n=1 Tax=Methylobacterium organophilum TaxID=410 RepID=A0ABQ4T593_METOR|nr:NepR family anti-sigma factor [Methylobacterium organophilum]UMY17645.1 anti-sigma factor [Methylobacterium organophilum]GJE26129.1 hypothetical protein LKMONMHP_0975 [Methylobacterium organophilum]
MSSEEDAGAPQGGHRQWGPRTRSRGMEEQTQKRIGIHLRALYDSVVEQPIPDRFKDLIARLDDSESAPPASTES